MEFHKIRSMMRANDEYRIQWLRFQTLIAQNNEIGKKSCCSNELRPSFEVATPASPIKYRSLKALFSIAERPHTVRSNWKRY